jgi:hypothetical protein
MNKFCEHGHVISMLLVQMPEEFDVKIQNSFLCMKTKQLACSDASFCISTSWKHNPRTSSTPATETHFGFSVLQVPSFLTSQQWQNLARNGITKLCVRNSSPLLS